MEVHLPCPPLREWLPVTFADLRVGVWAPRAAPRRLRGVLSDWPALELGPEGRARAVDLASLDVLMFAVQLDRPEPPEACLELLRPGTRVIELGWPRARPLRRLLGLDRSGPRQAQLGQSRVLQWLARGYFEIEQWESVEPDEVLVTLARAR
ncbi:hypothetical protein ACNOYE_09800 [Nannocystaceae bacterium ST9]